MATVTIEIPEELHRRLGSLARPFVDQTPASVIEWLVDSAIQQKSVRGEIRSVANAGNASEKTGGIREFDPTRPPNLFHTIVHGEFAGTHFSKWNDLMRIALETAYAHVKSLEELRKITHAQIREGNQSGNGYRFIPSAGISYQGVDANYAWRHALGLARFLKLPVEARVEWRDKEEAAYPGETGLLSWKP